MPLWVACTFTAMPKTRGNRRVWRRFDRWTVKDVRLRKRPRGRRHRIIKGKKSRMVWGDEGTCWLSKTKPALDGDIRG